jgi:hypothetical protein
MRRCKEPGSTTNARPMPYRIAAALSMPLGTAFCTLHSVIIVSYYY